MAKNNHLKKIVILRTDRIGEVLLSTVAVDAVKKQYPDARISFVTSEYSRPLVEGRGDIDKVISMDTMHKANWVTKAFRLAGDLRRENFDAALVLNPHKALHLACFMAGIPRRAGYGRKWGFLLTDKMQDERDKGKKHEVEYTMEFLRGIGMDAVSASPRLSLDPGAEKFMSNFLFQKNIDPSARPLIAVHPGSSNPEKIWLKENYSELLRKLRSEINCDIAVIGDKNERDLAEEIIRNSGEEILDLSGMFDLKKLAAFLRRTSLFIGNDAGPMHMAASLGVPVVAIFQKGASNPVRWRPWGEEHVVLDENKGEISAEEVFSAALQKLRVNYKRRAAG